MVEEAAAFLDQKALEHQVVEEAAVGLQWVHLVVVEVAEVVEVPVFRSLEVEVVAVEDQVELIYPSAVPVVVQAVVVVEVLHFLMAPVVLKLDFGLVCDSEFLMYLISNHTVLTC